MCTVEFALVSPTLSSEHTCHQMLIGPVVSGLHIANETIWLSVVASLAVFDISKAVENGVEITPEVDPSSHTIRYASGMEVFFATTCLPHTLNSSKDETSTRAFHCTNTLPPLMPTHLHGLTGTGGSISCPYSSLYVVGPVRRILTVSDSFSSVSLPTLGTALCAR